MSVLPYTKTVPKLWDLVNQVNMKKQLKCLVLPGGDWLLAVCVGHKLWVITLPPAVALPLAPSQVGWDPKVWKRLTMLTLLVWMVNWFFRSTSLWWRYAGSDAWWAERKVDSNQAKLVVFFGVLLADPAAGLGWQTCNPASYRSILQFFAFCFARHLSKRHAVSHQTMPGNRCSIMLEIENNIRMKNMDRTMNEQWNTSSEGSGEIFHLEGSSFCAWCMSSLESQQKGKPNKSWYMLRRNWCCEIR